MPNTSQPEVLKHEKHVVLYDDACPFCMFQMKLLKKLDWLCRLRLVAISDPETKEIAPHITRHDLLEAIHCVACSGKIYRGARCIRFVGLRLPLAVPIALFLWIPGIIYVAERFYMMVSRNRLLISKFFGCKDTCSLPPR